MAACGCKPGTKVPTDHERIVTLENQIAKMNAETVIARSNLTVWQDGLGVALKSLGEAVSQNYSNTSNDMEALKIIALQMQATLSRPAQAQTRLVPLPIPRQTRDGVPLVTYNTIRADAERRYPTDFDMQEYIIKQQITAYKRLNP